MVGQGQAPLWDISAPVHPGSPVYPGDAPYEQQWCATLSASCPVNLSVVRLSPHIGTHADAPLHYANTGAAVGALALEPFIGPCRVIHVMGCGPCVQWQHLAHAVADVPPRVLLRTYQQAPSHWDEHLTAVAPETLERLADAGVVLLGTDSASIDPANSTTLPSHQVLQRRGLRVLENLLLDAVPEGDYELIALPLRWMQAEAAPVRAILRRLPGKKP